MTLSDTPAFLFSESFHLEGSEETCVESKKGTGLKMGRPKWWYGPEYRKYANPPQQDDKPVCSRSEGCIGCPFPSNGFICWGESGDCMRTRFDKLKVNKKNDKD